MDEEDAIDIIARDLAEVDDAEEEDEEALVARALKGKKLGKKGKGKGKGKKAAAAKAKKDVRFLNLSTPV